MSNPNDPGGPPQGDQPDPTAPPADSPASPPAWQQPPAPQPPAPQLPPEQPPAPQPPPQQAPPPNQGWDQQQAWGQQAPPPPPPPPGNWQEQPPPQGAPAWDQPTQAMGWAPQQPPPGWDAPQPTQVFGPDQQQGWGPPQQGWGPPGYPGPAQPRRSRPLPWIVVGGVVVLLAVVGVLGFVAPGFFVKKVFDNGAVQDGVRTVLTQDYRLVGVSAVTCPAQQEVKVGSSFTCTATIDGRTRTVAINVQTSEGGYEVGRPT